MSTNTATINKKNSPALAIECEKCIKKLADVLIYTDCDMRVKAEAISAYEERLFLTGYLQDEENENPSVKKRRREKIYAEIFTEWIFRMYILGQKSRHYLEEVFINQVVDTLYMTSCMEKEEINMTRIFNTVKRMTGERLSPYCVRINWSFSNFADIPFINRNVIGSSKCYAELDKIILDNFEAFLINAGEKAYPEKDIAALLYTLDSSGFDFWKNKLFDHIEKEEFENVPIDSKVFRECLPKFFPELIPNICMGYLKLALNDAGNIEKELQTMADYKKYCGLSFLTADDVQAIISFVIQKRDGDLLNKIMKLFKESFDDDVASEASAYMKKIVADIVNSAAEEGNEDSLYTLNSNKDFFNALLAANNMMMVPYEQL